MKMLFIALLGMTVAMSCNKDDEDNLATGTLNLNISGLEDLGDGYAYEGWIIVDGAPITAGIFDVDANGNLIQSSFELDADDLSKATAYALTIEPSPDNDAAPSKVHILGGDFSGNSAPLTLDHGLAIGTDFTAATGQYILATPTDGGDMDNENSGIWWEDPNGGNVLPSLDLPTLPEGWEYEGWVVIDGIPVTTGKFLATDVADDAAPHSGTAPAPPYPGEDFLFNAPSGLNFPTDLAGQITAISVEPSPDNSPAPFTLKPLFGTIPATAVDRELYDMGNNAVATNPTGTVSR